VIALAALLLPIVPGALWMWIVYRTDIYEPEPPQKVLKTFALGVFSILPAYLLERLAGFAYPFLEAIEKIGVASSATAADALPVALGCFLVIGPIEELVKFAAVRLWIYRDPEFDEPLDGIIYASAAALGFASLENVFYVVDFTHGLGIRWAALGLRSFLALPGHVIFGATWGYALGRKKFDPTYPVWSRVALAAVLHGLYDFVLIYPPTRPLIILFMALMVPVLFKQIRALRDDSPFRR
jgi:RsiW-degrading membrane proteinase PrsW (M82 family)